MMIQLLKSVVRSFVPQRLRSVLHGLLFPGSGNYWEKRYQTGGNSGAGSYGRLAEFKAEVLNNFVAENNIETVIEFGCGDGNQLSLANYPRYLGIDVSETAGDACRKRFSSELLSEHGFKTGKGGGAGKTFVLLNDYQGEKGQLVLSLDVVYHLVEDDVFENYMNTLFAAAVEYVIVYSSNIDDANTGTPHVRHRKFTDWIEQKKPEWKLISHLPNKYPQQPCDKQDPNCSFADFYFFKRTEAQ